ncbi:MAG: tryptophan 7-halogenase [Acidobacteriota bacterium]
MTVEEFDVAVIGGGPAGSTVGRLLVEWGHSVLILCRPSGSQPALAESLPPSSRKLFDHLGILGQVDEAGFYRSSGNTVWWGEAAGRVETFPGSSENWGYQVLRSDFDHLLLQLAGVSGACVHAHGTVSQVDLETGGPARLEYQTGDGKKGQVTALFVLDCSGRAGVLARRNLRKREPGFNTFAIAGVWERESGWQLEDESHTLVETYRNGWAWSIPPSPARRYFTVMLDPETTPIQRSGGLKSTYLAEIEKTTHFRRLLMGSRLQTPPWGCDASLYSARRFAGPQFLLVGDAGSFIDPLSSFGVKKALASAWMAAVVVNTCLRRPEMANAALEFFSNREQHVYLSYLKQSTRFFAEAAAHHPHPFWNGRSRPRVEANLWLPDEEALRQDPEVLAALDALKQGESIRLRRSQTVSVQKGAGIQGREVVLEEVLVGPNLPGVRFLGGVDLPVLVGMAAKHRQVPDLFEAYNRICPPVELPNFLGALSVLLAKGILIDQSSLGLDIVPG